MRMDVFGVLLLVAAGGLGVYGVSKGDAGLFHVMVAVALFTIGAGLLGVDISGGPGDGEWGR